TCCFLGGSEKERRREAKRLRSSGQYDRLPETSRTALTTSEGVIDYATEGEGTEMLENEYRYYQSHEDELLKLYEGKFIAIVGEEIVGVFDAELAAYTETKTKYPLGTFLLQHVLPKKDRTIHRYHSRVAFG
ncbi:MAG: DUF5678 domain-containing protein, partial [Deltaproteobacteria bacterium]